MKKIGLLSDTHGYIPSAVYEFFQNCDEIWHAGDAGNIGVLDSLRRFKPLRAVYGNIDGQDVRISYPEYLFFKCEDVRVLIIHIGGYPRRYSARGLSLINQHRPGIYVSGHSHILKVIYDHDHQLLHINPGAAGKHGLHQKITLVRFVIDGSDIRDLEIYERGRGQEKQEFT